MADNQAQQRDQDVVVYSAFAGVRNDVTAERFSAHDLVTAENCDLDKSGRLARRGGTTKKFTGAAHSIWSDDSGSVCLMVAGGYLKKLNVDYSATAIKVLHDGLARMSYTAVNGAVYFSNGVDTGVIQEGIARSWGIAVPGALAVQTTVGQMPAGRYQFVVTYLREDGQESGAGLAGAVTVTDGAGLLFTTPVSSDPSVLWKIIYLTTPNGDMLYRAVSTANATQIVAYANDTSELNTPIETQFLGPAPAGQLVARYRGHMLVAVEDTIYPSEEFAPEWFDLRRYITLDGRITMLAVMEDKERSGEGQHSGLFIGTDKSCGVLVGTSPDDFQYVPKTSYGAVIGAMDYVDGSVFGDNSLGARPLPMWLTTQGICVGKPDMEIQNLTRTKYGFPAAGQGAAIFIPGANRFIASSNF